MKSNFYLVLCIIFLISILPINDMYGTLYAIMVILIMLLLNQCNTTSENKKSYCRSMRCGRVAVGWEMSNETVFEKKRDYHQRGKSPFDGSGY